MKSVLPSIGYFVLDVVVGLVVWQFTKPIVSYIGLIIFLLVYGGGASFVKLVYSEIIYRLYFDRATKDIAVRFEKCEFPSPYDYPDVVDPVDSYGWYGFLYVEAVMNDPNSSKIASNNASITFSQVMECEGKYFVNKRLKLMLTKAMQIYAIQCKMKVA